MIRWLYRRWVLWRCRSWLSNVEDAKATLEGQSRFPVWFASLLVSVAHPVDVDDQHDLLEAEREYYQTRVEMLEGRDE
jgi:hypothetical protein